MYQFTQKKAISLLLMQADSFCAMKTLFYFCAFTDFFNFLISDIIPNPENIIQKANHTKTSVYPVLVFFSSW